jgi:diadenosine tetraphosphate (Ap4A) HIT family hydrolase
MAKMRTIARAARTALLLLPVAMALADVSRCACDPTKPETLEAREFSLCSEAERHVTNDEIFFLRDINPRKPNRWLALPRAHGRDHHPLREMSNEDRTKLWTAAIHKAKELWGDEWGIAYNGDEVRTQCHAHVHIGKYLRESEAEAPFQVIDGPAQIPVPQGEGMWIHPEGAKLHVHSGPQITERFLLR